MLGFFKTNLIISGEWQFCTKPSSLHMCSMHFLVLTSDRKTLGSVLACFKHIETTTKNTSMECATGSNSLEVKMGAVKDEPMTQVVKNLSNKLFQSVISNTAPVLYRRFRSWNSCTCQKMENWENRITQLHLNMRVLVKRVRTEYMPGKKAKGAKLGTSTDLAYLNWDHCGQSSIQHQLMQLSIARPFQQDGTRA